MMTIAQIMEKMIAFSEGNIHDITHLSCVWTYAKTIGELEGLDAKQWKSTSSANPVIPLISICWKIKRKENIGLLIRKNASSVLIKPMLFTLIVIIVHTKKQYEKNLSFIMFHFIHNFRTCTILQY